MKVGQVWRDSRDGEVIEIIEINNDKFKAKTIHAGNGTLPGSFGDKGWVNITSLRFPMWSIDETYKVKQILELYGK
jgi:hypothetical protein